MRVKGILRFYYAADSLERAINNLIFKYARSSAYSASDYSYADKICELIGEKQELSRLWSYLDGVIRGFGDGERVTLEFYAALRFGINKLCEDKRRVIKRVVTKFTRRARRLERFEIAAGLVGKYYALMIV